VAYSFKNILDTGSCSDSDGKHTSAAPLRSSQQLLQPHSVWQNEEGGLGCRVIEYCEIIETEYQFYSQTQTTTTVTARGG
jgi:hypothetical protein